MPHLMKRNGPEIGLFLVAVVMGGGALIALMAIGAAVMRTLGL